MQDRSPLNLTSSLQLGIQVKCFKLSETSSKFCLLSPTSQILWSQQHFCPPHLTVLACISNFLPPMDSIYSYRHISSDERVVLIRNPILANVNRDVDLIHFFWIIFELCYVMNFYRTVFPYKNNRLLCTVLISSP